MKAPAKTSLDENEKKLVDQTKTLDGFTHRELTELARQLRSRRERILRMIRGRKREARQQGALSPDTGAHDKKAELIAAIDRVNAALEARAHAHRGTMPEAKPKAVPKDTVNKSADAKAGEKLAKKSASAEAKKPAAKKSASK